MAERKVINKYYPADFDPSKIKRIKRKVGELGKPQISRIMLPITVHCNKCSEYIYAGKKFNARKETCAEKYLTLSIYRFIFKCPVCLNEIVLRTDPQHNNYLIECGATKSHDTTHDKLNQQQAEYDARIESEKNDVLLSLENKQAAQLRYNEQLNELQDIVDSNTQRQMISNQQLLQKLQEQVIINDNIDDVIDTKVAMNAFNTTTDAHGKYIKRIRTDTIIGDTTHISLKNYNNNVNDTTNIRNASITNTLKSVTIKKKQSASSDGSKSDPTAPSPAITTLLSAYNSDTE